MWPTQGKQDFAPDRDRHGPVCPGSRPLWPRFGEHPKVGDTFCGGGSIPFEAARLGCDVYASDLNPIACTLTWGALNIIGASSESRREIERAQSVVAAAVDRKLRNSESNTTATEIAPRLISIALRCAVRRQGG